VLFKLKNKKRLGETNTNKGGGEIAVFRLKMYTRNNMKIFFDVNHPYNIIFE
jgi:hypothetical protein